MGLIRVIMVGFMVMLLAGICHAEELGDIEQKPSNVSDTGQSEQVESDPQPENISSVDAAEQASTKSLSKKKNEEQTAIPLTEPEKLTPQRDETSAGKNEAAIPSEEKQTDFAQQRDTRTDSTASAKILTRHSPEVAKEPARDYRFVISADLHYAFVTNYFSGQFNPGPGFGVFLGGEAATKGENSVIRFGLQSRYSNFFSKGDRDDMTKLSFVWQAGLLYWWEFGLKLGARIGVGILYLDYQYTSDKNWSTAYYTNDYGVGPDFLLGGELGYCFNEWAEIGITADAEVSIKKKPTKISKQTNLLEVIVTPAVLVTFRVE